MHFLIGLVLVLAVFYSWLVGHWFARVMVCIVLSAPLVLLGLFELQHNPGLGVLITLIGMGLGWVLSSVPTYVHRRRDPFFDGGG